MIRNPWVVRPQPPSLLAEEVFRSQEETYRCIRAYREGYESGQSSTRQLLLFRGPKLYEVIDLGSPSA